MNRVGDLPINDGLQRLTESWAQDVADALQGVYGRVRRSLFSGISKAPARQFVSGSGPVCTVFMDFPSGTATASATVTFVEGLPYNGVLLVYDRSDKSVKGQLVTDGVAALDDHVYGSGFVLSGSLSLTEE